MTDFPTAHTVTQRTPAASGEDDYGNPIEGWVEVERAVYGWWVPGPGEEPEQDIEGRIVADVALVAPTFPVSSEDQFLIDGFDRPLRVEGLPQVYDNGPWGWKPGMRVNLKLVKQ